MKHGGLKLLGRSLGRLTPRYETEARGKRERVSKPNVTWEQGGSAACKAGWVVAVTPPAQGAFALISGHDFGSSSSWSAPEPLWEDQNYPCAERDTGFPPQ